MSRNRQKWLRIGRRAIKREEKQGEILAAEYKRLVFIVSRDSGRGFTRASSPNPFLRFLRSAIVPCVS